MPSTWGADTFTRSVSGGWGTAEKGGSWVKQLADPDFTQHRDSELSVNGSAGQIDRGFYTPPLSFDRVDKMVLSTVSLKSGEVTLRQRVTSQVGLTSASFFQAWIVARSQGAGSDFYFCRLTWRGGKPLTAGVGWWEAATKKYHSLTAGSWGHLISTPGIWYRMRFTFCGFDWSLKVWEDGTAEPVDWEQTGFSPLGPQTTGQWGLRIHSHVSDAHPSGAGLTDTNRVKGEVDDFKLYTVGCPDDPPDPVLVSQGFAWVVD